MNDGSSDNSLKILEQISNYDSRIKIVSQENSGPAKARKPHWMLLMENMLVL